MFQSMAHVAVVVSNLERSRKFYENTLGFKPVAEFRLDDRQVDEVLHLSQSRMHVLLLRAGDGEEQPLLELTRFDHPRGNPLPRNFQYCNAGCTHVAFWVNDLDQEYQRLKSAGVRFNSEPKQVDLGNLGTLRIAYFKDPDGVTLEMMEKVASPS